MSSDPFIEGLVKDLKPVRRRRVGRDALILAALGAVELALFITLGPTRPDMPMAMDMPSFWWKFGSLGLIAIVSGAVALFSFDPLASPRRGLRWLRWIIAACLAGGWVLDAVHSGSAGLLSRINWQDGLQCVTKMVLLSVPAAIALGVLMRRGAPTDAEGTALAVGLTAASWGAFVFVFACPYDDPLYVALWYVVGCGLVTVIARVVLPRLARW